MFGCVIIDDETRVRNSLRKKIEDNFDDLEILGEGCDMKSGYAMINQYKPELVFLDVSMPDGSGFDLLRKFPDIEFEVIFVTAHDHFSLEAIQYSAVGFLVKPVKQDQLEMSVQNARKRIERNVSNENVKSLIENIHSSGNGEGRVGVPTREGLQFIKVGDIIRCEGSNKYTKVVIREIPTILSSYSIGKFKGILENYNFYLCHKSHLINVDHIITYLKDGTVIMSDESYIPVSVRRRVEFYNFLSNRNKIR